MPSLNPTATELRFARVRYRPGVAPSLASLIIPIERENSSSNTRATDLGADPQPYRRIAEGRIWDRQRVRSLQTSFPADACSELGGVNLRIFRDNFWTAEFIWKNSGLARRWRQ